MTLIHLVIDGATPLTDPAALFVLMTALWCAFWACLIAGFAVATASERRADGSERDPRLQLL